MLTRQALSTNRARSRVILGVFVLSVLAWLVILTPAFSQEVRIYVSSKSGDRITPKSVLRFEPETETNGVRFQIKDGVTDQKIIGFGASFLEAGMICLNSLKPDVQESVLCALFDPEHGAGFSAMKSPIAGTDFMSAGPFYSYDDTPGDAEMKHFSIARDLGPNGVITYIKRARKHGDFVIQAPMDYPPDWMLLYDVNKNQNVSEIEARNISRSSSAQDVNPKYYDALAHYYLKYVQEYQEHGVFIDYLSLFNEPGIYTKIPYTKIRNLLKNYVGPLFQKEDIKTKIQLSEAPSHGKALKNYPTVLDDPEARKYVSSVPYHGYGWMKDRKRYADIAAIHKRYPLLPLWMTEVCHAYVVGTPKSMPIPRYDFEDGDFWGNMIMSDLEAGATGWTYWNMILDQNGGPWMVSQIHRNRDHNVQHPVVIINRRSGEVTYTGLYYYLAHFSKFVRPGSLRVETAGTYQGVRCMAFKKPDEGFAAELINSRNSDVKVQLDSRGQSLHLTLPAVSITTCLWNHGQAAE